MAVMTLMQCGRTDEGTGLERQHREGMEFLYKVQETDTYAKCGVFSTECNLP